MAAFKDKKNGSWYVQFRYTDWRGERQQKLKRGFATKKEAQAWEREFLMQKQADINMSFESFVALYEKDVKPKLKLNTWLSKEHIIRTKILPYFKKRKLSEITARDVIDWQNEIRQHTKSSGESYSPDYLKNVHTQLSCIFNHAIKYYGLQINPAAKAGNMGSEQPKEMLFWTKEEYLKFIDAMMDKPMLYYAFEILYWCGIREGELLALTPADFDFEKKTLRINKSYQRLQGKDVITTPKTKKSNRVIQMPDFLCDEMQDYFKQLYGLESDSRIFPLTKHTLKRGMEFGCKASGVKIIRIHDLRHPYVKHTTKIFSLRLMDFQAQAYPDARRKTRGACQLLRVGQSRSPVRPLCNRKRFSCLPPQSKMSWILYAISMRLSGYTSTRSISSSASSVVSVSASKIALDASFRLSCRACSSCFCFACANTAA
jgi:integrase